MNKEHRISAAAIIIQNEKILLVRYAEQSEKGYLVGPGGGVQSEESLEQGMIREVKEETGLDAKPSKMLFVEDLLASRYRIIKFWFLCDVIGGQLLNTPEAKEEGIIGVDWYSREQLKNEIVYPTIVMNYEWNAFVDESWNAQYLGLKRAHF